MKNVSPIVSVTTLEIFPDKVEEFRDLLEQSASLHQSVAPLRLIGIPEKNKGNGEVVTIHYFKGGVQERKEVQAAMKSSSEWKEFVKSTNPYTLGRYSNLFKEAPFLQKTDKAPGLEPLAAEALNIASPGIIEAKRAKFQMSGRGGDAMTKFLTIYKKGLAAKVDAPGVDPSTTLVTVLYSKNDEEATVMEIWRHDDEDALDKSRAAMRNCQEWMKTAAFIKKQADNVSSQTFKSLSFSPIH